MARGGRRGYGSGRGKSRSVAQSGGKANKFSDGKKGSGTTWTNQGGSRGQSVVASGTTAAGNKYKVRRSSGDTAKAPSKGRATPAQHGVKHGAPTALSGAPHPRTNGSTAVPYPKLRKGAVRQAGGSTG